MMKKKTYIVSTIIFVLGGCNNTYWTRQDAINFNHGDAVRSNIAVMVPDPWPKGSENNNIPMDPVKAANSIKCYRLGQAPSDPLGNGSWDYKVGSGVQGGGGATGAGCQATGARSGGLYGGQGYAVEGIPPMSINNSSEQTPNLSNQPQ